MRSFLFGIFFVLNFIISILFYPQLAFAQIQDNRWQGVFQLSSGEGNVLATDIVSDQYGNVHVLWVENSLSGGQSSIFYTLYDGEIWTTPIDIYSVSRGFGISNLSAAIDQHGMLHLIWTEGGDYRQQPIFYSRAPANNAGSVWNWQKPIRIDVRAHVLRLLVDKTDKLHILFSRFFEPEPGVYYINSIDGGETWKDPLWLDPDIPFGHAPYDIQFAMDEQNGLHAVWFYGLTDVAAGNWVRYAGSLDGGVTWSSPFTIDRDLEGTGKLREADPVLTVQGQNVHVVWGDGAESIRRSHRMSRDAGRTWGEPVGFMGDLNGQAFDGLTVDGEERVHFLGQIRYPQGIYHSFWNRGIWSSPELVYLISLNPNDPIGDRVHAHRVRPAVRAGNQLVVTFTDSPGDAVSQIYVMVRTLDDIASIEPIPTPTSTTKPIPTVISTSTHTNALPTQSIDQPENNSPSATQSLQSTGNVIMVATIPTIIIVGILIAFRALKRP